MAVCVQKEINKRHARGEDFQKEVFPDSGDAADPMKPQAKGATAAETAGRGGEVSLVLPLMQARLEMHANLQEYS